MRYHLILVRKVIIKMSTNNKCWRGCEEKGTLLHCWWECIMNWYSHYEKQYGGSLKLKIELLNDPPFQILSIYSEKKKKILIYEATCIPVFTAALVSIAKTWKRPKCH